MIRVCIFLLLLNVAAYSGAQNVPDTLVAPSKQQMVDYNESAKSYILEDIVITGTNYYDKSVLQILTGLTIGQKIKVPGDDISKVIVNMWKQKLFDDVNVSIQEIHGDRIILAVNLREKPKLSNFSIKGLSKSKANSLREELTLKSGQIITDNTLATVSAEIKKYFKEKGFLDTEVRFEQESDDVNRNTARLRIIVDRGPKIKIHDIKFDGNTALSDKQLRKLLKDTKRKRALFAKSRYDEEKYQDDKQHILEKYLSMGFRDIEITSDSVYRYDNKTLEILIRLNEGHKYYYRDIKFVGNTKYTEAQLQTILKINKGDVYDQSALDTKLHMNPNGVDISTLYMDDGYLFFNIQPIEVLVENDSIDLEIRMYEGKQARINKVTIAGNTKTSDHVILRELRTKPGQLFSRSDVQRSMQALSQIGYFNPEALGVNPVPNQDNGTVDIEYKVEERPNDQIELSAGWGANSVVGTLGLTLNNFSTKRMFESKSWAPIPSGDGQRISLRAQTNGTYYRSYSASFTEPWLGGRKPKALSLSVFHSLQSNGYADGNPLRAGLYTTGGSVGLGKRLKFPDDFFTLNASVIFQKYTNVLNYLGQSYLSSIPAGSTNSFSIKLILARNSTNQPIYPSNGSNLSLSLQMTPPYSLMNNTLSTIQGFDGNKWLEFYKWKFDGIWFAKLAGNKRPLVLMARANFGFIGRYNPLKGYTPFERFWLGGAGLMGFSLDGRELIALRGYQDNTLTPLGNDLVTGRLTTVGGLIYNKFTMELRYPISLNPSATVFPLLFLEAGKAWNKVDEMNPFDIYRSAGFGVRIFLPMFGMIGLDWGYGFDEVTLRPGVNGGNFHFLLGQQF
jgi:outer membrane protein insertion porin family